MFFLGLFKFGRGLTKEKTIRYENSMCSNVTYFVFLLSNLGTKLSCRIYCYFVGFTVLDKTSQILLPNNLNFFSLVEIRKSSSFWLPGSSCSVLG